jgi:CheY-like chemotaxis protein
MFAQGQAAKTQGGLGIGLTLVRKLIELHGGRVEALSPGRGQGSTVQVYLPLARAQGTAAVEPRRHQADRASGIEGRHILVVDDNRDAATSLARALELRGGARVQVAHDGRSVLEALAQAPPQVVILDIGLPDIDGHEVARRIRSRPEWSEVWLIAMTGLGDTAVRRRSLAVGFDHHLVKPVPFDRLDQVLAASVGRRAAVEGRLADIEAPQVATLRAPASEGLRSVDAFAASLLHDLAQPLSSAACYMMAAKTLAGQAGHVAEPLHHALASVEEQMEHARKLLELLRGVLAQPEPNESAGSTGDLHA